MEKSQNIDFFFEKIAKKSKNAENRPEKTRACDHTNLAKEFKNLFLLEKPIFLTRKELCLHKKTTFLGRKAMIKKKQ